MAAALPPDVAPLDLSPYVERLERLNTARRTGTIAEAVGLTVEVAGLGGTVGEVVTLPTAQGPVAAEIVGFRGPRVLLMPLGELVGLAAGARVETTGAPLSVPVGPALLGRVLDGLGRPMDGKGPLAGKQRPVGGGSAPDPLTRRPVDTAFPTGVRVIDGLLTCGRGQRIGIFAGSGVGKSTTLGMIARHAAADLNVICLVGERGREVREFLERDLGDEGLARSVVVIATSDTPALVRIKACWVATAIAEAFRDEGRDVLLLMDSVTRLAMAQREVGLAAGEPPALRGYPPSVFATLPRLLERAGGGERGSITAFYTVLVEGDDLTEPVTDTARGTLDGHIVLSRALAGENHYPAVDVLASVSRVMPAVTDEEHLAAAGRLRSLLAAHQDARDLIAVGAYVAGTNPAVDRAVRRLPAIHAFLRQRPGEATPFADTVAALKLIADEQG
ncbi:MAG TPA: FliI/YscN family ATPase [Dehalococcoidia bacterium]|nr:FliI/YscN family ATPase [Dehalococcoidia bacterium]